MQSSTIVLSYKPFSPPTALLWKSATDPFVAEPTGGLRTVRGFDELRARPNRRFWMSRDVTILERHYSTATPVKDIAQALDRSVSSLRAKARQLGLRRQFRHAAQAPLKLIEAQRRKLKRDIAGVGHDRSTRVSTTPSGRVIWSDELLLYLGELWKRLYSPAAIGGIFGLDPRLVSTAANRVELPKRTENNRGGKEFLDIVPARDPLEAPVCKSIADMMEPITCIVVKRVFFRDPRNRGRRISKAGREILDRQATGMMH